MSEFLIQSETLDDIADAINAKLDTSVAMTPSQMVTAIAAIPGGVAYDVYEYTQAEDWLTAVSGSNPKGSTEAVAKTYLTQGDGLYHVVCTNNNASERRFDSGLFAKWGSTGCSSTTRDGTNTLTGTFADNSRALYITAGAKITVTFFPRGDAP